MVSQCNIRQFPWEVLKTAAFDLGFQHLPWDLANVNAWKTMFDPYIAIILSVLLNTGLANSSRWSVQVAEWLALPGLDPDIPSLNPTGGKI